MKNRLLFVLGGMALLLACSVPSTAADKIQAFVVNGKIVYTNGVENTPAPIPAIVASTTAQPTTGSSPIDALIDSIAINHGIDPALVRAMIKTESNFNRRAVSNKGARGLMQLIPETGTRYGVHDFFDPRQNIEGGVSYIKFLLEKFNGDLDLSLAAYNAGENLVERLGRIPSIPETRDYVRKVRANYGKSTVPVMNAAPVATVAAEEPKIFRTVDERGVAHYSNVAPPR